MALRIAVLFGGTGEEHDVSLDSAAHLLSCFPDGITPLSIGVTREGEWHSCTPADLPHRKGAGDVTLARGTILSEGKDLHPDAIFPVLHGRGGEDGTVAGLLESLRIPFVGCDTAAGAIGMNKARAKALLPEIPSLPHLLFSPSELPHAPAEILRSLGLPVFVKPNGGGSSIGATPVTRACDLPAALHRAAASGDVLCEPLIAAREIEVGILETEEGILASRPGEVRKRDGFYDFTAKYQADTALAIPAEIPPDVAAEARAYALLAFRRLGCRDLARVDFFFTEEGRLSFNEINTMPGFTAGSMYPRLWEKEGYPLPDLLELLCRRAAGRRP